MCEYPTKNKTIKIITRYGNIVGQINISGFNSFSEYMEKDKSLYLKVFNINTNTDIRIYETRNPDNFVLVPKSKNNLYIPLD